MTVQHLTEADSERARRLWAEYQQQHDLSARKGQTVGIDPLSGTIWFGESMQDVVAQRDEAELSRPLVFERVGYPTYLRKVGRREFLAP